MKEIITIPRVNKEVVEKLIELGILYTDDKGIHVRERRELCGKR